MKDQSVKTQQAGSGRSAHQIIEPPNKLKEKVRPLRQRPGQTMEDPVARAERELKKLEPQFGQWMGQDIDKLRTAWTDFAALAASGADIDDKAVEPMFHAAHDIKGQASTFGHPYIASIAGNMCMLIDNDTALARVPRVLVEQHVNAIVAIFRENGKPHANTLAYKLSDELSTAARTFIVTDSEEAAEAKAS